jgi:hypothetical protein
MGLTAMVLAGSACVVDDADDSAFLVDWSVALVGGGAVSCEAAETPNVVLDAEHLQTRAKYQKIFPCAAGRGVSDVLPLGPYSFTLSLRDPENRPLSSISGQGEVHRHGLTDLEIVVFEVQAWRLTWLVEKAGRLASCAQAGGKTVEFTFLRSGDEKPVVDLYECGPGGGVSPAIRTGNYGVEVRLLDAANNPLSLIKPMQFQVLGDRPAAISFVFEVN